MSFSTIILSHKKTILIATAVITLFFGIALKDITINPDMTSYLPKNDPVVTLFNHVGDTYGGNALAMVALETENVFTYETLTTIKELTDEFRTIPGIKFVTSLTNIIDIKNTDNQIEIGKLIDEYNIPDNPGTLAGLKAYTLSKDKLRGRIVSEDGRLTLIICHINKDKEAISKEMKKTVEEKNLKEKVYYSGLPFQMNEVNDFIIKDLVFLVPLILIVIFGVLFVSFRTVRGVLLPLLSVSITSVWTLGLMSLLNVSLTVISNVIPVIIIAVGSAYSIHVISKFYEYPADQRSRLETSVPLLQQVTKPVLLTGITTIGGFLSFVFGSYLVMIREFGIFSAIGVFFTLINSITFVPAMLVSFNPPAADKPGQSDHHFTDRLMSALAAAITGHRRLFLIAALLLAAFFIAGIPKIERKVDFLDYFKKGTAIRQSENMTQNYFGGSVMLQLVVKGDIQDPRVLKQMEKMKQVLNNIDGLSNATSIADYIEDMSDVIGEGKTIPDSKEKVQNLWFLLDGEDVLAQLVNEDYTEAIIQATQRSAFIKENAAIVSYINDAIKKYATDYCSFRLTGTPAIYKNLDESLLKSQMQSLTLALIFIALCLTVLLRSVISGLIGMIPIVLSLIIVFGFMGYAFIPLDVATVLVASVSLGIGVDYAIHFVSRLQLEQAKTAGLSNALNRSLKTTGRAILVNVLTVAAGFLVLVAGNLVPLQRFGILIALTMVSAGLGALTVIPATLLAGYKNKPSSREEQS